MKETKLIRILDQYYEWDSNPKGINYFAKRPDCDVEQTAVYITKKKKIQTVCNMCDKKCRWSPTFNFHWNFQRRTWLYSCSYCQTRMQVPKKP